MLISLQKFQVLHIIFALPVTQLTCKKGLTSIVTPCLLTKDMLNVMVNLRNYTILHQPVKTLYLYSLVLMRSIPVVIVFKILDCISGDWMQYLTDVSAKFHPFLIVVSWGHFIRFWISVIWTEVNRCCGLNPSPKPSSFYQWLCLYVAPVFLLQNISSRFDFIFFLNPIMKRSLLIKCSNH